MSKMCIICNKKTKEILMSGWLSWICCILNVVLAKTILPAPAYGAGIVAVIDLVFGNHMAPLYSYSKAFVVISYATLVSLNGCVLLTIGFRSDKTLNRWLIVTSGVDFICTICYFVFANLFRQRVIETALFPTMAEAIPAITVMIYDAAIFVTSYLRLAIIKNDPSYSKSKR